MIRISYLLVGLVFFFLSTNVYCQKKILVGNSNDKIYFQKNDTLEEVDFNGKLIFKKKLFLMTLIIVFLIDSFLYKKSIFYILKDAF